MEKGSTEGTVSTTSENNKPWGPARPLWTSAFDDALELYSGGPPKVYSGPTTPGMSGQTQKALNWTELMAENNRGVYNKLPGKSMDIAGDMNDLSGQLGKVAENYGFGVRGAERNFGKIGDTAKDVNPFLNRAEKSTDIFNKGINSAYDNAGQYDPFMDSIRNTAQGDFSGDSSFKRMRENTLNDVADTLTDRFGASGRFGSGINQDVMAKSLSEASDKMNVSHQGLAASQLMSALSGQQSGLATAGDLGTRKFGGLQTGAGIAGTKGDILSSQQGALAQRNDALAGRVGAVGAQGGMLQAEQGIYDKMGDTYDIARKPIEDLAKVGGAYDQLAQNELQGKIDQYNAEQSAPWQHIARLLAVAQGAGSYGTTLGQTISETSSTPGLTDYLGPGANALGSIMTLFGL